MRRLTLPLLTLVLCAASLHADEALVKDGQARAEIVIAPSPPRMVKLAAVELQTYVEKMTGAKLPIVTTPNEGVLQIYVGKSEHTERLEIRGDDIKHGGFRIVSNQKYLALVGRDSDFQTPKFYLTTPSELPKFMKVWDQATGEHWGFANGNLYKEFHGLLKAWNRDERGSLNAVYEFLRMQGIRWYLPDELGEHVPKKTTLLLPKIDRTVRPDFALRYPYQYGRMWGHAGTTRDEALWQLRLGWSLAPDVIGDFGMSISHGMNPIYERQEVRDAHPEYYTLFGGKRDRLVVGESRPCLSSKGLFEQNVKYVRTMFDLLNVPMVSVMPQDGYVNLCQCELCKGKGTLERGWEGQISDYVWNYVNKVAKEVYKTHPDRKVSCCAYGAYLMVPTTIDKLSPNIIVGICQNRSQFMDPVERKRFADLRAAWLAKMPEGSKQLITYDYYLHTRPFSFPHMPYFYPRAIADDLKSLKGRSIGDFIEVYRDKGIASLAVDHLNLYVTSRYWWDADQNIDTLLDEYCTDFYGPAAAEMKALIDYSETNLIGLGKSAEKITKVFELLERAQKKVTPESIHGKRVAYIAEYLRPMRDLGKQLAQGRTNVPEARIHDRDKADIKLDGKLDDKFWQSTSPYALSELETGRDPYMGTTFRMGWADNDLYIGIRCEERDTKKLNIGTKTPDDPNIWNGDCVEILLETQPHSYYQFAINPAGILVDLDRKRGLDTLWNSGAQVATHIGEGYWSAEIRIPVLGEQQETIDPKNGVAGRKPSANYPWYFNVCRQRMRASDREFSAFSPTGEASFHILKKFAKTAVR